MSDVSFMYCLILGNYLDQLPIVVRIMTILPMEGNIWYDITWRFKILVSKSVLEIMFLSQQGKMT